MQRKAAKSLVLISPSLYFPLPSFFFAVYVVGRTHRIAGPVNILAPTKSKSKVPPATMRKQIDSL